MTECVDAWCSRCSRFFPIHLLCPVVGPGPKEHVNECVGCDRPPVLFVKTDIVPKPYDMPVTALFYFDED